MKVAVRKPCSENWQNMTKAEQGRFCASCQKTVVDFSRKSDYAISKFLNENKNTCGKFSKHQLNRTLQPMPSSTTNTSKIWPWLLSGLISIPAAAQETIITSTKPVSEQFVNSAIAEKPLTKTESETGVRLKGQILDKKLVTLFLLPTWL